MKNPHVSLEFLQDWWQANQSKIVIIDQWLQLVYGFLCYCFLLPQQNDLYSFFHTNFQIKDNMSFLILKGIGYFDFYDGFHQESISLFLARFARGIQQLFQKTILNLFIFIIHFIRSFMAEHKHGCCPPGSWPALNVQYQPKGETFDLNGVKVYHVGQGKRVLIIFSDIFGAFSGRHQGIADTYAEWGYNVYLPEILSEIYTDDPTDFAKIVPYAQGLDQGKMRQTFMNLVNLLEQGGHKQYFAVGFCWGVWKAFTLAAEFDGFISIVGFHPSIICETLMGGNEAELTKKVKAPAFFYPAGNDVPNIKQGGELVQILQDKFGSQKSGTHTFADMTHGWVVRGDLSQEAVHRDIELALDYSRNYLNSFEV